MKTINKNTWLSAGLTASLFLLTILLYDITYWINDDVMLESILSGSYTGTPEFMTYYFSVPLAFIISCLYRLIPAFSWFGLVFIITYLLCFYLITKRCLIITNNYKNKKIISTLILLTGVAILYFTVFIPNIVLLHYTLLAAITGATGLFLLITIDSDSKLKQLICPVILIILSYLIRENVFFMLMPFFAVSGLYRLIKEGSSSFKKYISAIAIFSAAFIISFLINKLPYTTDDWKNYVNYNQIRTELYDFVNIQTSDSAMDYYHTNGIDNSKYDLYRSYNILLADDNSIETLNTFINYNKIKYSDRTPLKHLKEAIYVYIHSFYENKDLWPLIPVILALYVITFMSLLKRDKKQIITLFTLFVARSIIWIYLFWNDRYPIRVTYSLLYIELFVLLGILLEQAKYANYLILNNSLVMLTLITILASAYFTMPKFQNDYDTVISVNKNDDIIYDYIKDNPDKLFFIDVFVSVNHTHKVFANKTNSLTNGNNYMLLGGWMTESPLTYKKLALYNAASASELIKSGNAYLILKENMYNNITIDNYKDWLGIEFTCVDKLEADDEFLIYLIQK